MAMTSESNRASARAEENPHDLTEMSLENLMNIEVYSASKYLQSSAEAPASVTIITSDDIRKYGFQSLAEILQSVRGFYVTYDRNYSYAGIRGFGRTGDYNTRVLLLIDGHRLNDDVYDEALLGTEFPLDVDLIDRVEVIRGPSSSLYGSNAYFGVVNVITRRARDVGGAEASTDLGSFGTYKGRLTYGHRFKKGLSAVLSTSFYRSQGQRRLFFSEFDNPATNNGIAENADGDRFGQVFGSAAYRGFTLQGVYGSRRKQIPTASFGTVFDDPRTRTSDQEGYLDLQYDHTFRREIVFRWATTGIMCTTIHKPAHPTLL
jgi:iron complex outermembrane receptor protein